MTWVANDGLPRSLRLELGVRPGDVVALQLPNCWQPAATARLNAVVAPITTAVRPGQLAPMLARTRARVS